MHSSLLKTEHRPWPLPSEAWSWRQSWNDLLFVHYRAPASELQKLVPSALKIQEFDGSAWIGIVPFEMNSVMRRPFPNVPLFSNFLELNVRFYVEYKGKPGVWFLSLDATNPLVVWGGNQFFHLPYKNARIQKSKLDGVTHYKSARRGVAAPAEFEVEFLPSPEVSFAPSGSLEAFLTERYCFYANGSRGLVRADVHHWPWPLQKANGKVVLNSLLTGVDFDLAELPLFHHSKGVDVVCWNPAAV